jgi:ATP-dependent Clp protease adaptor protein ClpS
MKYCKHTSIQAEQCAWIVHSKGKCSVKEGTYSALEPLCTALCEQGLTAQIELV